MPMQTLPWNRRPRRRSYSAGESPYEQPVEQPVEQPQEQPAEAAQPEPTPGPVGQPGNRPIEPSIPDWMQAMYEDRDVQNALNQGNFGNRTGALDAFRAFMESTFGQGQGRAGQATERGIGLSDAARSRIIDSSLGTAQQGGRYLGRAADIVGSGAGNAINAVEGGLDQARGRGEAGLDLIRDAQSSTEGRFNDVFQNIGGASRYVRDQVGAVEGYGDRAMGDFRNQTANMMGSWKTGQMEQTRALKDQRAAEMQAAGYRPEEIQQEMRRLDLQGAQQQAGQLAQFEQFEETRRGDLRAQYDTLATTTRNNVAGLVQNLSNTFLGAAQAAEGFRSGYAQLASGLQQWMGEKAFQAGGARADILTGAASQQTQLERDRVALDQWQTDVMRQAEMGGLEASQNAIWNGAQLENALSLAGMSGMGNWAGMWQQNSMAYEPVAPILSAGLSAMLGLEDRQLGMDWASLGSLLNSMSMIGAGTNQAVGNFNQWQANEPNRHPYQPGFLESFATPVVTGFSGGIGYGLGSQFG